MILSSYSHTLLYDYYYYHYCILLYVAYSQVQKLKIHGPDVVANQGRIQRQGEFCHDLNVSIKNAAANTANAAVANRKTLPLQMLGVFVNRSIAVFFKIVSTRNGLKPKQLHEIINIEPKKQS
jgi:hypothetical protein